MGQKAKITRVGKVSFDELALRKRFSGVVRDVVQKKVEGQAKASVTRAVKAHAKAAINSVSMNLASGFPNPAVGGSKRAKFLLPSGEVGYFRTRFWPSLTQAYRARWPMSRVYWRKHFIPLVEPDYEPLLYSFRTILKSSISARSTVSKLVNPQKNAYTIDWDVLLRTSLPLVLEVWITGSLLSAEPQKEGSRFPGVSRNEVTRIAYVEGRRPFIAGMSAAMGRRMRKDIAKEFTVKFLKKRT